MSSFDFRPTLISGLNLLERKAIEHYFLCSTTACAKPQESNMKKNTDRNLAILKAYGTGSYSMQAIDDYFELHYSSISRFIKWARECTITDLTRFFVLAEPECFA